MRILGSVLMVALSTSSAHGQAAPLLADVTRQVEIGDRVRVLRVDGTEIRGELSALEPSFLAIDVSGRPVRIDAADVHEIGVKDGVWNGILIGLGAGLSAGIVSGLVMTSPDDGNLRGASVMLVGAVGLGLGIGLGVALDAASAHHRTIYGPRPTAPASPIATRGLYGATIVVRW